MNEQKVLDLVERTNIMLQQNYQQKHALGTVAATAVHRPIYENAFFQDCGLEASLFNTVINARNSIANRIPVRPNNNRDQSQGFVTGNDGTIDFSSTVPEATNCEGCVEVESLFDACKITYPYGRMCADTKTLETNELIRRACFRQYDDFFIMGDTRGISGMPDPNFGTPDNGNVIVQSAVLRQISRMAKGFQNATVVQVWTGDPGNNIGTQYAEYWGLDNLINGDYVGSGLPVTCLDDAQTASALNSDVKDFGGECIGSGNNSIYEYLQELMDTLNQRADGVGTANVEWGIFMIRPLWTELVKAIPCEMAGNGCVGGQSPQVNDGASGLFNLEERRRMENSMSIPLGGRNYPVYIDDGIPYTLAAGVYNSSIYVVPLSVDGESTLYWEHMDYRELAQELSPLPNSATDMLGWTDGGRYHLSIEHERHCFLINAKTEMRLVFKAPHLAGRIDDIDACPLQEKPMAFDGAGARTGQLAVPA